MNSSSRKSATVALVFSKQISKVSPSNSEPLIYFTDKCPFDLRYLNGAAKTFVETLTVTADENPLGRTIWEGQYLGSIIPSRTISEIFANFHE